MCFIFQFLEVVIYFMLIHDYYDDHSHDFRCSLESRSCLFHGDALIFNYVTHNYVSLFMDYKSSAHLRLWSHLGHRPPTSFLQASRFWASLSSCPHVWPICIVSASSSRRQVILGRHLFVFPLGFHVRDCLVVFDPGLRRV